MSQALLQLVFYISICHFCISGDHVIYKIFIAQFPRTKKTIGGNTYTNEMVAYFHMKWPNHAKLIKAAAPKVALMKGTHINRPRDFDILTNEKSIRNFYKGC